MSAEIGVEDLLACLPPEQRKHLDPASPLPMRMMAAKGMAPLSPREMVVVLCGLSRDGDEKIALGATKTLVNLPDKLLGPAVDELPAPALGVLASAMAALEEPREAILEKLVLNRQTPDEAIAILAPTAPVNIAEIIVGNQERCMRSAALVDGVRRNPNLSKSSLDRLFDFLVRSGVIFEDFPEFTEAIARLSHTEMAAAAEAVKLPAELAHLIEDSEEADARAAELVDQIERADTDEARARIPIMKLVASLNAAQKVSLALKGNKEARTLLIRDSNKVVCTSAIRNPRVTEPELISAAQSRSVSDDVIRIIARSKEMTRTYMVKKALVYNPKTPVQVSMQFLALLRQSDLAAVAKSRNVASPVSTQAKRLLARKK